MATAKIDKFLNNDVQMTIATAKASASHVENIVALVNSVNLDKETITSYLKGFESAVLAAGMSKASVKVLKSNRKCIMEFSVGMRKGQEDKEFWNPEACKKMAVELGKEASDISDYAGKCRKALTDEEPEPEFNFEKKLDALIEKAYENGYEDQQITEILQGIIG